MRQRRQAQQVHGDLGVGEAVHYGRQVRAGRGFRPVQVQEGQEVVDAEGGGDGVERRVGEPHLQDPVGEQNGKEDPGHGEPAQPDKPVEASGQPFRLRRRGVFQGLTSL